jgi:hypothetical protein
MNPGLPSCPICKLPNFKVQGVGDLAFEIQCYRCGRYRIDMRVASVLHNYDEKNPLFAGLSAYSRQESEKGNTPSFRIDNWENLAAGHINVPVLKKLEKLERVIADRSTYPGFEVKFSEHDFPLVDAASSDELVFLVNSLRESGLLIQPHRTMGDFFVCMLTAKGWANLQEQTLSGIPGRCFVAMSFDPSLDEAWVKGIEPALRIDCGLDPIRVDKTEHNEKICDKIIAEIRLSQFLVADFTLHRQGVYFEAGFALGLGRPVIWMCRKDELIPDKVHFDTRQYNHIKWTTPEDLRVKLRDRVIATIPETATQSFSR